MIASRTSLSGLAAAFVLSALAAGCSDGGMGLSGAKHALLGKPAPTPDLPERPKLVMPPSNSALPVPGQGVPASPQWTTATQGQNPQTAAAAPAAAPKQEDRGWFSGIFGSKTQ